ncbi:NAD(P)/FAD-dependent oxidoreductase [Streptomyces scopuliridis]|uniref:NAD(P)/FAD-dependent oxidoreductase n=1 Tax=Streptomyces scopuliridis TaxID=452529 RepID=UPI003439309D
MLSTALSTAHHADVVIIGAGLAGLAAAHHLTSAGVRVSVLEAAPHVGGRMATDRVDGFRLDRGGRLLTASYPELLRTPGLEGAALRMFSPGVVVHSEGRNYRTGAVGSARSALTVARALASAPRPPLGGAVDQARLGAALGRLAATPTSRLLARPERTALEALSVRGLPVRTVNGFVRPLLSALLCDPDLTTSSRCADLALRAFARGRLCVTAGGSSVLPELLARTLPEGTVRTDVCVTDASISGVTTKEHGEITCRSLVVATGARAAAELLPGLRVPDFHPVTVLHHTAPAAPLTDPALLLDADRSGPVAHTSVMSAVDPSRAPEGRALISSTVLGPPPPAAVLDRTVRAQLARLYGTPTGDWELLAVHHDPEAVPAMPPPHDPRRPVRLLSGLYVCGDHRDTNTVQGALFSGRRAAHAILRDLGVRPAYEPARLPAVA